jgi:hypothetical protein
MSNAATSWLRATRTTVLCLLIAGGLAAVWPHLRPVFFRQRVVFSRDIRPIFNQNCVSCHGGVRQKNGVSFIYREEALGKGKSGRPTIVPGSPDASELMRRVNSTDSEVRMPYHAPPLAPEQIELLRRWIKEGAPWDDYWAFVPPRPQPLPKVKQTGWARQPEDRFILARLEKESLSPSPGASKAELLRRVSFDLTGLPPTAEEQAAYLGDSSPNAYEKQVDRLLASPAYGERWASMWLDLARYADTKGYEADRDRLGAWPYRNWVIEAFNRNLPFDEFVTAQLAGDLRPNPTFDDLIATSFHRQTPNNEEDGTDNEEFRMVAVMDRVATTWSVLNGITMNCVQCHSHPYDPIHHAEYYKSLAFFNTQNDGNFDDDAPTLAVPKDKSQFPDAARIQQEMFELLHSVENSDHEVVEQARWNLLPIQKGEANEAEALEKVVETLRHYIVLVKEGKQLSFGKVMPQAERIETLKDLSIYLLRDEERLARARTVRVNPKSFHMRDGEAFSDPDVPVRCFYQFTAETTLPTVSAIRVEAPPLDPETARHTPEAGFIVDEVRAFVIQPDGHKKRVRFRTFLHDAETNLEPAVESLDGGQGTEKKSAPLADGFMSDKLFQTRWIVGLPAAPLQLTPKSRIEVDLRETQEIDGKPARTKRIRLSISNDPRWTTFVRDSSRAQNIHRLKELKEQLAEIPSVHLPVTTEEARYERRATKEFERGNFLTKTGPDLQPDVPAIFPSLPPGAPRNRLTLAKWFFSPEQPLTARVTVNRYWEELFGTGIVETLENFGSVGEEPSHPELLDWLALHFQNDLHWDMKALLRELVTSATYRQSAVTTPALEEKDPRNRLLARGPQQRLTAEMVRDQALVASGLLSRVMGGPPVMPPQPAGVWNSAYNYDQWKDENGPNRFRRAVYTFVKRTSGYPSFLTFDSSDRDTSLPRRIPTNTPLQALVTLNDPVYQEAARALARRVMNEVGAGTSNAGNTLDARLMYEARLVLSRDPTPGELATLRTFFEKTMAMSRQPSLVRASMDLSRESKAVSRQELDALTAVGSVLLNLDAALTR